jgi:hypothetical protein
MCSGYSRQTVACRTTGGTSRSRRKTAIWWKPFCDACAGRSGTSDYEPAAGASSIEHKSATLRCTGGFLQGAFVRKRVSPWPGSTYRMSSSTPLPAASLTVTDRSSTSCTRARAKHAEGMRLFARASIRQVASTLTGSAQTSSGLSASGGGVGVARCKNRAPMFKLAYGNRESVVVLSSLYPHYSLPCLERKRRIWDAYRDRHQINGPSPGEFRIDLAERSYGGHSVSRSQPRRRE